MKSGEDVKLAVIKILSDTVKSGIEDREVLLILSIIEQVKKIQT